MAPTPESTPRPQRLGVFGGAFDPPHLAHRALAEQALSQLALDQLRVIPTGHAWHKPRALSAPEHRLAMTQLAFADLAGVQVDARELMRTGPSYTVDTLRELQAEQPQAQLFLLVGRDQAEALPSWQAWQEVVGLAIICVADRDGVTRGKPLFQPPPALAGRFVHLHMPPQDLSATDIRAAWAAQPAEPKALVSPPVARYIAQHHLYTTH